MPSYKNIGSFIRYHGLMAPGLRASKKLMGMAVKAGQGYVGKRYPKLSKLMSNVPGAAPAAKVVKKKVARAPKVVRNTAPKVARTPVAPKAKVVKAALPKPVVSKAKLSKPKTPARLLDSNRVGTVKQAISSSKTHGQLRRKLTGMAVRHTTKTFAPPSATRADAAAALRKIDKQSRKAVARGFKHNFAETAAKHLSKG